MHKPHHGYHGGTLVKEFDGAFMNTACGGGQEARELACDLRCNVAHGGQHGNPSVLQLHGTAAPEGRDIAVGSEAKGIPEALDDTKAATLRINRKADIPQCPVCVCVWCAVSVVCVVCVVCMVCVVCVCGV